VLNLIWVRINQKYLSRITIWFERDGGISKGWGYGIMGYTWRWFFVEREITKPF
jgi:hypothetical protein